MKAEKEKAFLLRFRKPKDFELITKAAGVEVRSMNNFIILAACEKARATMRKKKGTEQNAIR